MGQNGPPGERGGAGVPPARHLRMLPEGREGAEKRKRAAEIRRAFAVPGGRPRYGPRLAYLKVLKRVASSTKPFSPAGASIEPKGSCAFSAQLAGRPYSVATPASTSGL